jgi:hypothetical protein
MSVNDIPSSRSFVVRKNIRKSQSDVGMRTQQNNFELDYFGDENVIQFREMAVPKLKRHLSDQTAEANYEDVGEVEPRKRNKENCEVPRAFKAQADGWLRVRNHVVKNREMIEICISRGP